MKPQKMKQIMAFDKDTASKTIDVLETERGIGGAHRKVLRA